MNCSCDPAGKQMEYQVEHVQHEDYCTIPSSSQGEEDSTVSMRRYGESPDLWGKITFRSPR